LTCRANRAAIDASAFYAGKKQPVKGWITAQAGGITGVKIQHAGIQSDVWPAENSKALTRSENDHVR